MTRRIRVTSRLRGRGRSASAGAAAWICLVAITLVFKSFVPLLAATAAQMQGKAVGDVCDVYGVKLVSAGAREHGHHTHAMEHMAGQGHDHDATVAVADTAPAPSDAPADTVSHRQDHCALTGLAACAVIAASAWAPALAQASDPVRAEPRDAVDLPVDSSARWLTLRLHAPPAIA